MHNKLQYPLTQMRQTQNYCICSSEVSPFAVAMLLMCLAVGTRNYPHKQQ